METEAAKIWRVLRTDDAGNVFLVRDELSDGAARALVDHLTARGHKQTYAAVPYCGAAERAQVLERFRVCDDGLPISSALGRVWWRTPTLPHMHHTNIAGAMT